MPIKKKQTENISSKIIKNSCTSGDCCPCYKGQKIKIINTHGNQVVDFWAFNSEHPGEFMSMEHCRVGLGSLPSKAGGRDDHKSASQNSEVS